ncbi:TIGR04283 family arsenosugar biosynthesis glycosyltransferase [Changchengzhania lutea]|uniref:TIGR04283 family arsenosugar biosynthesis glycosyltransferase n=1 Tax=Changchengzhania lutea TaxID=2049305 RepID=UPI00115F4DDD|nr:TIGR04283 family arsenosugar biosynthesis glycosyltransferase [Changchengzhania lutea]
MSNISIIIPMLNEAKNITHVLQHLIGHVSTNLVPEIIIVDGGSTDGSQNTINRFLQSDTHPQILLLNSEKGRAKQMNLGAQHAKGKILYFLHADSFPPKHFDELIINEIENGNKAGCFRMQFNNTHWWLQLAGWLTQFKWRACRGGDQSQFITKTLFKDLGGFDEDYIIYEDNDLISKLYAIDEFTVIQKKLTTSARLYQKHGVWKLQFHFWNIYVQKWFGASATDLHQYYKKHIAS